MIEPVALGLTSEVAYPAFCSCGFIRDVFFMPHGASQEDVKARRDRFHAGANRLCARVPESHSARSQCVVLEGEV